jgi:DNA-binding cell septation regulator SpoVG
MKKQNNENTVEYSVEVLKAKEVKDGKIIFDMEVNSIKIYGCWYNEYKTKDGKDGTMLSFPSYKGSDGNYYNYVWFPISTDLKNDIIAQIEKLV